MKIGILFVISQVLHISCRLSQKKSKQKKKQSMTDVILDIMKWRQKNVENEAKIWHRI